MQDIKLNLAIEDVNLILEGLGNMPYAKVYTLVAKIQEQAARQLEAARPAATPTGAGG
ncbi:conserved hypothetical protein [Rubrivivax sp. A210]|uniref:hypothetical protein n=1 Tax=Rubrivivax sp. A210 TaxID=2772301 RepID=UPI00191A4FF6|nr:hypothetical protein [Rubrivivax sp. A210]CAD5372268.1 conserved hypothetical protein [Rubrivivax sp. A210]